MSINRRRDQGFSMVEILLAVALFGMLSSAVIGAIIYGRTSTAGSGDRVRATYLADEGIEAVRNIRRANYTNLVDGTYGLVQAGGVWTLSGSSDTSGIYTRTVTIATAGTNRKTVTSNVNWTGVGGTGSVQVTSQLSNWMANLAKSWAAPTQYGSLGLTGAVAGYKVATNGNYAYIIRNTTASPNFFIINISTPTAPTLVGSMTLAGTPSNLTVNGNFVYVSNNLSTAELQIVNVTTPATPTLSSTYNATGTAGGLGVFNVGTTVYLTRAANAASDEFVIVNAATPTAPVRVGGYPLAVAMYEVYVNGTTAYVATGSDTQELLVLNITTPATPTLGTSINLTGTADATTISGLGTTAVVGQATVFYTLNLTTALVPTVSGTLTLTGTIADITNDIARGYAFVGSNLATGEFRVINISNLAAPVVLSTVDVSGSLNLPGVAYNGTYDVVVGASSSTTIQALVFGPNPN